VFRGPNGAAARVAAQHSQDYAAWYSHVPGLKVVAPYTAADAKGLLKAAIRDPNPVIFLENEILYGQTFEVPKLDDFVLPIGKARIARPGKDVTIVSFDRHDLRHQGAAELVEKLGIDVEVIDLRTLRPMDTATIIASVKKTGRSSPSRRAGRSPASAPRSRRARWPMPYAEAFDYLDAPVIRVTGKDVPMPYAANLEKLALPNVGVVDAGKPSARGEAMPIECPRCRPWRRAISPSG
jgi:pyruvate dehydrogenase E1 component beta subunit